ncbi:transcriptional regulator, TetR family [Streptoalloteichus tenebrarius]|uniref:Transcriptional regulator, TetR family n=1 Tax=Streptoalloteichus tenebrarius (strain ATCC 17920 / DSM 40477 / JCM 4838 / CBS 697.72 / NBRC 16177 / NCIMB 11028 / NRRL B-12390 / A12253. 1 / ISP 5477) TaxID=1933 RepID=A0ABT1HM54_STRSD|nr:TetR/AcrR family transcriptional regulator [Streptoalloteichus tenebrarius]MCP2256596.1 transcriptional regulator, TetR family [Streptoalloteichus tenebrarius]BFF04949.1 TetR/AcrR family transcriptional regulator [Streptoalloteichus tenebrarius]
MGTRQERADAARNREAILAAATALFDREGVESVSMQDIAAAAGVGKGTVFRRFGDRTALVHAVLEPRVAALRESVEGGPPPLGPGGDPHDALVAYVDALFAFVWRNRPMIRALEHRGPDAYYANDASQFWIEELDRRLAAAGVTDDTEYLAHAVFTALRSDVIDYLVTARGMTRDRVLAGIQELARGSRSSR